MKRFGKTTAITLLAGALSLPAFAGDYSAMKNHPKSQHRSCTDEKGMTHKYGSDSYKNCITEQQRMKEQKPGQMPQEPEKKKSDYSAFKDPTSGGY